jgi:LCP family protein required for cell wall assembly
MLGVVLGLCVLSERWLNAQPFRSSVEVPVQRVAHVAGAAARSPRKPNPSVPAPPTPIVAVAPPLALAGNLNLLLVGLDRRPGATRGGRPDTIIIASFSEEQGQLGLVSIPRDLYVEIPGFGFDRINATAAAAAKLHEDPGALLERVLESTLEIEIAHSVIIDLGGFERAIDAIGGVEIDVPCAIADNFVDPRQANQRRMLDVDEGWQHMNGTTAAMYVRSRHGRSDWSRARRQQAVLLGIKRRMLSAQGLTRVPALLDSLESLVTTDLSRAEMLQLAARALGLEPEHVHGVVIGYRETEGHRTRDGKSVLLPKPAAIRAKLDALFSAQAPGALPEHASCPGKEVALQHVSESEFGSLVAPTAAEAPSEVEPLLPVVDKAP